MKQTLTLATLLLSLATPLRAQNWSLGAGTGAFVFGDFVERKLRPSTGETPSGTVTRVLSAATRPGLSVDVQHDFAPRWGVRLEGTFTHAPLRVKEKGSDDGVSLEAGDLDVATFTLPLVFRINTGGAFRFYILGGPAYAIYHITGKTNASGISVLDETRDRFGLAAGAGVAWWTSDRFAIEGNITDVSTSSPFEREDFPDVPGFKIPRPHNVHTTVGVRWKF